MGAGGAQHRQQLFAGGIAALFQQVLAEARLGVKRVVAFLLDIWFGSIRALPKGQWEASRCLGLSFGQTLYRVVAPQALRIAIAPTVGFAVQVIKGTALASIIGFVELTKAGTMLTNVTYQPFKVFALVALGYFILCYPLSRYSRYLENKFNASHHH